MVRYVFDSSTRQETVDLRQKICFVCLGNIVRSPLAESMFAYLAEQDGVGEFYEVDSAGISGWHVGEPPDARMIRVASQHGFTYDGRSRQFRRSDFDKFDWIIAMDQDNADDLLRIALTQEQAGKIHLFRSFDPLSGKDLSVPDPYYGGIQGFENVYQIVERSTRGLLNYLEQKRVREGEIT